MIKVFIIIIAIYLFTYCFILKQDYINVSQIIKMQINSIIKSKTERRKSDLYAFINIYLIPLLLSFLTSLENIINKKFYDNIIVILAILVSVFLTMISILTSKSYGKKTDKQKTVVNLTYNNVYFLTILSTILLILCFLKISISSIDLNIFVKIPILCKIFNTNNYRILFNTVIIYLIMEIIIHLLIVLKRIQQIFFITFDD